MWAVSAFITDRFQPALELWPWKLFQRKPELSARLLPFVMDKVKTLDFPSHAHGVERQSLHEILWSMCCKTKAVDV